MSSRTLLEKIAHIERTKRMLKTAEPTMVPMPTLSWLMKTPITEVKSSGGGKGRGKIEM